jgi:O-antigen biosynthesis protein
MKQPITLSIIIVNYNVREFLEQALNSLQAALVGLTHEIWVVDNASTDGSVEWLASHFPQVRLIANSGNVGFARANNQALAQCNGRFICLLNPDTIVQENTFSSLLAFFEQHPRAGAVGCKVLNPDGSLQLACRRSFPTPWVALTKIIGLATLFPRSRIFGRYNLTYLDPEQSAEVEAISGSFMLIRRETVEQVGLLDEAFFMYGEDLDYCYRIRAGGWQIHYVPDTRIIHFKGESSKKSPFEERRLFYEAMRLFVHKHFRKGQALVPMWSLLVAIRLRAVLSFLSTIVKLIALPAVDVALLTVSLAAAVYLRFEPRFPWRDFLVVHVLYSAIWLLMLSWRGVYKQHKFSTVATGSAMIMGWIVNSAITFFLKEIGFSRLVVLYAGLFNLVLIPGWRLSLKAIAYINYRQLKGSWGGRLLHPRALLVLDSGGSEKTLQRLRMRLESNYTLIGIVLVDQAKVVTSIRGLSVLGTIDQIEEVIRQTRVQDVIFATERIANYQILSIIAASHGRSVSFKWIPAAMDVIIGKATVDYVDDVPFLELDDKLHHEASRWLKRGLDVTLSLGLLLVHLPIIIWYGLVRRCPIQRQNYMGYDGQPFVQLQFVAANGLQRWYHKALQWWPIFIGKMSMVGVQPQPYDSSAKLALLFKPGWTGLERLQANLELTAEDRERLHLHYMKNYSVLLDLEIIFRTAVSNIKR